MVHLFLVREIFPWRVTVGCLALLLAFFRREGVQVSAWNPTLLTSWKASQISLSPIPFQFLPIHYSQVFSPCADEVSYTLSYWQSHKVHHKCRWDLRFSRWRMLIYVLQKWCGFLDRYRRFGRTYASNFIVEESTLFCFENGSKLPCRRYRVWGILWGFLSIYPCPLIKDEKHISWPSWF
jgi:hypothetical protein